MSTQVRVLAVISNQNLLAKVENLLRRRTLEVNHVSSGAGALVLAGNIRYELVIAEAPLADLELEDLLGAMRALDSLSGQASFLVLTVDPVAPVGLQARRDDTIKVMAADADERLIHETITDLLGIAARRTARLLVQVEIQLDEASALRLYQSQNLSESGILLRGGRQLEIGSKVGFNLALPGGEAIEGTALVVRHTSSREPVAGTALRFLTLQEDDLATLRSFVSDGLAAAVDEPLRVAGAES